MASIIRIDGSSTLDLNDIVNYGVLEDGWAPNLPQLRRGAMGNQGAYTDVDEDMTLDLYGTSHAVSMANLATLQQQLDEVDLWWAGEANYQSVLLQVQQGPSSPLLSCALVPREDQGIQLPSNYSQWAATAQINEAVARLRRRGQWLASEETKTATSQPAGVAVEVSYNAGAIPGYNPLSLDWTQSTIAGTAGATVGTIGNGMFFYTTAATRLGISPAAAQTPISAPFSTVNNAATFALNTDVLRYTPTVTTAVTTSTRTFSGGNKPTRMGVWATVRNNTAGKSYLMRVVTTGYGRTTYGPYTAIDYTNGQPEIISLGTVNNPLGHETIAYEITALSTGGTIDFDTMIVCGLANRTEGAIRYGQTDNIFSTIGGVAFTVKVDHALLTSRDPFVGIVPATGTNTIAMDYSGNASLLTTGGATAAAWVAVSGANWRPVTNAGVLQSMTFTGRRSRGYAVPV